MAFILDLQNTERAAGTDASEGAASVSTDSWFLCQSDASNVLCITT